MQKQQLTVDGKVLGRFPKSARLKKLSILKGIEVKSVEESPRERALRLQANKEKRKYAKTLAQSAEEAQPSLIDGVPTVATFH